jgi:hypothetical protein
MAEQEPPEVEAVESKLQEENAKKPLTPEDFITRWPLYTPAPIEGFYPPLRVSYHCDSPSCGKETTWLRMGDSQYVGFEGIANAGYKWVWYLCGLCNKKYLAVMYRNAEIQQRPAKPRISSGLSRTAPSPPSTLRRAKAACQQSVRSDGNREQDYICDGFFQSPCFRFGQHASRSPASSGAPEGRFVS